MRCNSNCSGNQNSCNRRGNNGGNFQPRNNQSMGCGYNNDFYEMYRRAAIIQNQCNVFAATTTTPQTVAGSTSAPLTIQNILYNYGCAIQATNGASKISITQPGLYQVSHFVIATCTGNAEEPHVTVSLLQETTPVSSKMIDLEKDKGYGTCSDTCIVYISCHDIPKCISLQCKNTTTVETDTVTYQVFITINRICSCNEASCGALGENNCCCPCKHGCGCCGGYHSYCNGYMPGSFGFPPNYGYEMPNRNFTGGCGYSFDNGCRSFQNDGYGSSSGDGCGCDSSNSNRCKCNS